MTWDSATLYMLGGPLAVGSLNFQVQNIELDLGFSELSELQQPTHFYLISLNLFISQCFHNLAICLRIFVKFREMKSKKRYSEMYKSILCMFFVYYFEY